MAQVRWSTINTVEAIHMRISAIRVITPVINRFISLTQPLRFCACASDTLPTALAICLGIFLLSGRIRRQRGQRIFPRFVFFVRMRSAQTVFQAEERTSVQPLCRSPEPCVSAHTFPAGSLNTGGCG